MTPCKFQTDAYGKTVLIYSKDGKAVNGIARGRHAKEIRSALSIPRAWGKVYAMAEQHLDGQIVIGELLPAQDW